MAEDSQETPNPTASVLREGKYIYTRKLTALAACKPHNTAPLPRILCNITTPLHHQGWREALQTHPDREFAEYITEGISRGFRIGFNYVKAQPCTSVKRNMISAYEHPEVVGEYLRAECEANRVIKLPFDPVMVNLHTSRFGVIPKRNNPGKWRLILDLSHPQGTSVNDGIDSNSCSLSYVSVDDIAQSIIHFGPGALLAKCDVKSAYRQVPVHPEDRPLLGMCWQGSYYADTTLPFGLRSAPLIFSAIADALEWITRQRGIEHIYHYIDDFVLVGPPDSPQCLHNYRTLVATCEQLGMVLAEKKSEGPAPCLTVLGIEIDSRAMELRLPPDKLQRLLQLLRDWRGKKVGSRKELESLVGLMQHASKVVRPGRIFLRRLYNLLAVTHKYKPHYLIRINRDAQADIEWWCCFLVGWNGVSLLKNIKTSHPDVQIWSDASGGWGCGAMWKTQWFQLPWGDSPLAAASIAVKELLPILFACATWGVNWHGCTVCCHSDNQTVVWVINNLNAKDPLLSHMLRCLFFISAKFDFELIACHTPGKENTAADALSRNNLPLFFAQVPRAAKTPSHLPPVLVESFKQIYTGLELLQLDQLVRFFLRNALAPTTLRSYQSAVKRYHNFCLAQKVTPFPVTEQILCQFVASVAAQGVAHKSLKVYLSALRFFQISQFGKDPLMNEMCTLQYVLRGIKGVESKSTGNKTRTRLPITPAVLKDLHSQWNKQPPPYNHSMLWAASCTCFFGFLRSGEATVPSVSSYDPHTHLSLGDVNIDSTVSPRSICLLIKASKTDPFRVGVYIYMGKTECLLCPVAALLSYIEKRGLDPGPLFRLEDKRPLTRDKFVREVRQALKAAGYDEEKYAGHSFCIGAATTAAAAGIEDSLIKSLGRW